MRRYVRSLVLAAAVTVLTGGCATTANGKDPIEGFNRAVFAFNEGLDSVVIRPVAKGYEFVTPDFVRTGVGNFFGNIADALIAVNNLLQGKGIEAASVRDGVGLVFDMAADPVGHVSDPSSRNALTALRLVNDRAGLLPADKIIDEAALDKYSYLRDAYLQRRRNLVFDGRPPKDPDFE